MNYKFDEDKILRLIAEQIDLTYNEHYANNKNQATYIIVVSGHGEGFCMGNIIKYAIRYGKKQGKNSDDLLKIIHYAMIAFYLNKTTND